MSKIGCVIVFGVFCLCCLGLVCLSFDLVPRKERRACDMTKDGYYRTRETTGALGASLRPQTDKYKNK